MRILLLCSAFNGLSQRMYRELELLGCEVLVQLATGDAAMEDAVAGFCPKLIICPYLVRRIPASIWKKIPCLIVHPGIEGDRGPSSLDWAIINNCAQWGVTLLQAGEEMDAGDIWGSTCFHVRATSKASLYRHEVTTSAVALVKRALRSFMDNTARPRPLDPTSAPGCHRPVMTQSERAINWRTDSTDAVIAKLCAADSAPGIREEINGREVFLYGVRRAQDLSGEAGNFIAHSNGALCRATSDGAVWIMQAKLRDGIKLPAAQCLSPILKTVPRELGRIPSEVQDIYSERLGDVAYLYFNFAGGAMSTGQCQRLLRYYCNLKASDVRVIVLMGGEDFWSNGIHLNCIEASTDPAQESWENINAVNDLVEAIIKTPDQLTVAALRCNAGAGGAIMALACDYVLLRDGVVLNPHYRSMGLYGSEFWTYLLPRRVGGKWARLLTENGLPLLASEAIQIGYGDGVFSEDRTVFHIELKKFCKLLSHSIDFKTKLTVKRAARSSDEQRKPLKNYRDEELDKMRATFFDPQAAYHQLRRSFVFKIPHEKTLSTPVKPKNLHLKKPRYFARNLSSQLSLQGTMKAEGFTERNERRSLR